MRLVITGGTGFVGTQLIRVLQAAGHKCHILSRSTRNPYKKLKGVFMHQWDPDHLCSWKNIVDGADGVINLAGESVLGVRWTPKKKKAILDSRVHATRRLVESILEADRPPKFMISASAIGYYGHQNGVELTESAPKGEGFLSDVCEAWEKESQPLSTVSCRDIRLRIGLILHPSGGMLKPVLAASKWGVGAQLGDANQWMSWVHLDDIIGMIEYAMQNDAIEGVYNAVAPYPVTNAEFCLAIERFTGKKIRIKVPSKWIKRIQGEMGEMLVTSAKVMPQKMLAQDYVFRYPDLMSALEECPAPKR